MQLQSRVVVQYKQLQILYILQTGFPREINAHRDPHSFRLYGKPPRFLSHSVNIENSVVPSLQYMTSNDYLQVAAE